MKITIVHTPKKIESMFKKIHKNGMTVEDAYTYVGECMEDDYDRLYTNGDLSCAMTDVLEEALNALKDNPESVAKLKQHFGLKS